MTTSHEEVTQGPLPWAPVVLHGTQTSTPGLSHALPFAVPTPAPSSGPVRPIRPLSSGPLREQVARLQKELADTKELLLCRVCPAPLPRHSVAHAA